MPPQWTRRREIIDLEGASQDEGEERSQRHDRLAALRAGAKARAFDVGSFSGDAAWWSAIGWRDSHFAGGRVFGACERRRLPEGPVHTPASDREGHVQGRRANVKRLQLICRVAHSRILERVRAAGGGAACVGRNKEPIRRGQRREKWPRRNAGVGISKARRLGGRPRFV